MRKTYFIATQDKSQVLCHKDKLVMMRPMDNPGKGFLIVASEDRQAIEALRDLKSRIYDGLLVFKHETDMYELRRSKEESIRGLEPGILVELYKKAVIEKMQANVSLDNMADLVHLVYKYAQVFFTAEDLKNAALRRDVNEGKYIIGKTA